MASGNHTCFRWKFAERSNDLRVCRFNEYLSNSFHHSISLCLGSARLDWTITRECKRPLYQPVFLTGPSINFAGLIWQLQASAIYKDGRSIRCWRKNPFAVRLSCHGPSQGTQQQGRPSLKYCRLVNVAFILHKDGAAREGREPTLIRREIISHTLLPTYPHLQKHQNYVECADLVTNMGELYDVRNGILSSEGSLRLSVCFAISSETRFNYR